MRTASALLAVVSSAALITAPAATAASSPASSGAQECVTVGAAAAKRVSNPAARGVLRVALRGRLCAAGGSILVTGTTTARFGGRRPTSIRLTHTVSLAGSDAVIDAYPRTFRPTADGAGAMARVQRYRTRSAGLTVASRKPVRFDGDASRAVVSTTASVRVAGQTIRLTARDVARLPRSLGGGVAPIDEVPVDQTPVDQTPVDQTPVDQTPVDQTPVQQAPAPNRAPIAMTVLYRLHWGIAHTRFMQAADSDGSIVRYEITHRDFAAADWGFSADARTGQFWIKGRGVRADLTITFRALDDRGAWSAPATITISFRDPSLL